jgi:hypothetical protein
VTEPVRPTVSGGERGGAAAATTDVEHVARRSAAAAARRGASTSRLGRPSECRSPRSRTQISGVGDRHDGSLFDVLARRVRVGPALSLRPTGGQPSTPCASRPRQRLGRSSLRGRRSWAGARSGRGRHPPPTRRPAGWSPGRAGSSGSRPASRPSTVSWRSEGLGMQNRVAPLDDADGDGVEVGRDQPATALDWSSVAGAPGSSMCGRVGRAGARAPRRVGGGPVAQRVTDPGQRVAAGAESGDEVRTDGGWRRDPILPAGGGEDPGSGTRGWADREATRGGSSSTVQVASRPVAFVGDGSCRARLRYTTTTQSIG